VWGGGSASEKDGGKFDIEEKELGENCRAVQSHQCFLRVVRRWGGKFAGKHLVKRGLGKRGGKKKD